MRVPSKGGSELKDQQGDHFRLKIKPFPVAQWWSSLFTAETLIRSDRLKIEPIKARQKESNILSPTPVIQQHLACSATQKIVLVETSSTPDKNIFEPLFHDPVLVRGTELMFLVFG